MPVLGHLPEFLRAPEQLFWRGHSEHGNLFQMSMPGSKAVVLLGRDLSDFFFKETDNRLAIETAYPFFSRMFGPDFYFLGGVEQWKRQRDVVLPRFRGHVIDEYVRIMDDEASQFVASLGDRGEFVLTEEFGPLVMRIAARAFLGDEIARVLIRDGFFDDFRQFSRGMSFYLPGWLPIPRMIRSRRARNSLRKSLREMIRVRRREPLAPPDFLQTLSESRYPTGEPVPDEVLVNFVLLFCWAGHETTTGHLAWALADLIAHPDALERAVGEARTLFEHETVDLPAMKALEFTANCLHETERLHPVAHILARQAVTDIQLGEFTIPAGALVFAVPSVTHRLADEYSAPDEFRPDRLSGPDGRAVRSSLIGFGGGAHRCLGTNFAYLEMQIIAARLLAAFDLEMPDGMPAAMAGAGTTKWPAGPCIVRYRRRADVVAAS
ncbi:cytochrome P450 [Mycobacterium sp. LTG2003]